MLELALVFEPYFVDDEFYQPTMDFQNNELFIVLDSQVNDRIFNTFMTTWLCGQAVDKEFINGANEYEEIPFFGGLQLTMGDKTILPSCCARFRDIKEWAMNYLPKELQQPFVEVFDKCIDLNL